MILPRDIYELNHLIAKVQAAELLFRIERDSFSGIPTELDSCARLWKAKQELEIYYKVHFE
jgi:hypothetical protein